MQTRSGMPQPAQQLLLDRVCAGPNDGRAIGELLETFRTYLLMIGEQETGTRLRVKVAPSDLVQETLLTAHRDIANFRGKTSQEFSAWLRAIFLHKLAEAVRFHTKTRRRNLFREQSLQASNMGSMPAVEVLDEQTPSWHAIRNEELLLVRLAISHLPDRYREVIRLRNFEVHPFREIGRQLGCSPDAARALWGRAMQCLKELLDEQVIPL